MEASAWTWSDVSIGRLSDHGVPRGTYHVDDDLPEELLLLPQVWCFSRYNGDGIPMILSPGPTTTIYDATAETSFMIITGPPVWLESHAAHAARKRC